MMIEFKKCGLLTGTLAIAMGCGVLADMLARPNILFVMVDDLSPKAVGYEKGFDFLKTPNVDRIAREGAVFEKMFVTMSLCSPSRATMLTGTYAHKHGVRYNEVSDPDASLPTFPALLQNAGYRTALLGKWHMAPHADPRPGFDYWLSFKGQGEYFDPELNENGCDFKAEGYITDILTDKTIEFLNQTITRPFCVCLWHKANHGPFHPALRHVDAFTSAYIDEPLTWRDTMADKPRWMRRERTYRPHYKVWVESEELPVPVSVPLKPWNPQHSWNRGWMDHLRCQMAVDEGLGRIFQTLEKQGRLDDTLIIFTADNGFFLGEHRRGDKRLAYDESMRIPFCVRYPRMISPGTRIEELCANIDIAPTLLDLAGLSAPDSMQGQSFVPLMKGEKVSWRDAVFYEYFQEEFAPGIPTMLAVRTENWKYIHYPYETAERGDIDELYSLEKDSYEFINRVSDPASASEVERLKKLLEEKKKEFGYTEPPYRYQPPARHL